MVATTECEIPKAPNVKGATSEEAETIRKVEFALQKHDPRSARQKKMAGFLWNFLRKFYGTNWDRKGVPMGSRILGLHVVVFRSSEPVCVHIGPYIKSDLNHEVSPSNLVIHSTSALLHVPLSFPITSHHIPSPISQGSTRLQVISMEFTLLQYPQ